MHDDGEEQKRVSVGDALEALRKKKVERESKPVTMAPTVEKPAFIPPSFWLDNLQDGVQRSRDKLYETIAENPLAATAMGRRDFAATDSFVIPAEMLLEMGEVEVERTPESQDGSTLRNAAILDLKVLGEAGLVEEQQRYGEG